MMQMTELLYRGAPHLDYGAIKKRAEEIFESELDSSDPAEADKAFLIFHKERMVEYADGSLPAQTAILATDQAPDVEEYREAIQQSWGCNAAEELVKGCTACLSVVEMMSQGLEPQERVAIYHGVLRAAIEVTKPAALVLKHTQQIIEPADYLAACEKEPILRPGTLNVRFFNISNNEGEMLMDTRGLDEIGLHDLQCHFRELDPTAVASVLFNTAVYIFENGPVIESGQTVQGIDAGSKWKCQFETSLLEPDREVLDLNPGPPFSAGQR